MTTRTVSVLLLIFLILTPAATFATSVQPGIDALDHLPPSGWDFNPVPLPADFFGPGSDPFDGGIPGDQTSLPPFPGCPGDLGDTSILIERLQLANLPSIPSSDIIDIEIVALSLVGNAPITVTYDGIDPEEWNVEIRLSPTLASTGTMAITKTHANGGTFSAEITLQPYFVFTRVSDGEVRTLDGETAYADLIEVADVPWVYEDPALPCAPCASNFIPGHNGTDKIPFTYSGIKSQHNVLSSCGNISIPTLSQWGLIAVAVLLLSAGVITITRRRAEQGKTAG